jgi:hypothetical protein
MCLVYVDFLVFLFQHYRWTIHLKHQVCQGSESNPNQLTAQPRAAHQQLK